MGSTRTTSSDSQGGISSFYTTTASNAGDPRYGGVGLKSLSSDQILIGNYSARRASTGSTVAARREGK
jgi:hypothetical protein